MTQDEINQTEWSDPRNWSGPSLLGVYSSKKDVRLWVPKRLHSLGWTINLGRPGGKALLVGVLLSVAGVLIGASILVTWMMFVAVGRLLG